MHTILDAIVGLTMALLCAVVMAGILGLCYILIVEG